MRTSLVSSSLSVRVLCRVYQGCCRGCCTDTTLNVSVLRGMHDTLPKECRRRQFIENTARDIALRFGFVELICTPIVEATDVFTRTLGATSDVVTKEMYTFTDHSGARVSLRPENTAGVARALVHHQSTLPLPQRLFYVGSMFRHERPQKGRFREFYQFGVEHVGVMEASADVEILSMAYMLLESLGLVDRVQLQVNSIGDQTTRQHYSTALRAFLESNRHCLSSDSIARLDRGSILRVLDSKDPSDHSLLMHAPQLPEYLSHASQMHFQSVLKGLDVLSIPYEVNPRLVRGLDYYSGTTFEIVSRDLGTQGAVLAGGRYDRLLRSMRGEESEKNEGSEGDAAVGWAAGIDRLALLLQDDRIPPCAAMVHVMTLGSDDSLEPTAHRVCRDLRLHGIHVVQIHSSKRLRKVLDKANTKGVAVVVIIGEDELRNGSVSIRHMFSGQQTTVHLDEVVRAVQHCLC